MSDTRRTQLDALAIVLLVGCSAVWGLGQVAAKVGLAEMPPLLQAGLRSVGAAVLLLAWAAWRRQPLWQRDGSAPGGVLAGVLFAAEFACIFIGLQYTSASRMAVFIYFAPFVVALGMPFISRSEKLHMAQLVGLTVAFGGVVWAFAEGFARPAVGPLQWLGDSLGLLAAVLWGCTTLVVRGSRLATAGPEKTLLYQLAVSGVALAAAGLLKGEVWPATLSDYPATRISAFVLLTPVFGLLAGVLLLNEPLTTRLVVALAAVCVGIALVNRPSRA